MGLLEQWDEHNQRTAEWQNEVGRRNPDPKLGRAFGKTLGGMAVLSVIGSLVSSVIGEVAWICILVVAVVVCFTLVYRAVKRDRREWEAHRS